jgi:hypothetical protein
MQKHINYTDFFTFFLSQPIAILSGGVTEEEAIQELQEFCLFPITIIRDPKNPFFRATIRNMQAQGVQQRVLSIILPIGYHKEFLS